MKTEKQAMAEARAREAAVVHVVAWELRPVWRQAELFPKETRILR